MGRRRHVDVAGDGDPPEAPPEVHALLSIANVAAPEDNCAIALRTLDAGTAFRVAGDGRVLRLSHRVLEGHRFTTRDVAEGDPLLSWGLEFGRALRRIAGGEYLMNALMAVALAGRREVTWEVPPPNFADPDTSIRGAYVLDEAGFVPLASRAGARAGEALGTFAGYARGDGRGVGTRNYVAVVAATVHAAAFARAVVAACEAEAKAAAAADGGGRMRGPRGNVDGVCCVAHNEGGGAAATTHNAALVVRALANYVAHPNLGGVLVVGSPADAAGVSVGAVRDAVVRAKAGDSAGGADGDVDVGANAGMVLEHAAFMELTGAWDADVAAACDAVAALVAVADGTARSAQPVSALRVALQCGGSDAFSGITGNPLAGAVSREVVEAGGAAVLAETPELVGAEGYVVAGCASVAVAREYVAMTHRYQRYADRHAQDAAGNPSGGNLFRGLYNISLKSLGASRKKPADVALDGCVEWGARAHGAGYFFMDSPGNDLESIAGQVATGCNVIYFITGNGAITNFPFVPTLKFVTTSRRYALLAADMDVDAGELNGGGADGTGGERVTLTTKTAAVLAQTLRVAGGERTKGEAAGHAQVSLWRNWAVAEGETVAGKYGGGFNHAQRALARAPLACREADVGAAAREAHGWVRDMSGVVKGRKLVLSTSLCSGQIGELAIERLKAAQGPKGTTIYAGIPHTEGCGGSGGEQLENMISRTLVGHALHPLVDAAFVLEHGCEKTHNDWFLAQVGPEHEGRFGWGSVQRDGGIERNCEKITQHFAAAAPWRRADAFVLAVCGAGVGDAAGRFLGAVCRRVVALGGTVVVPQAGADAAAGGVLGSCGFVGEALVDDMPGRGVEPTVAYAERVVGSAPGVHVMQTLETMSAVEVVSGLAACGACAVVWWTGAGLAAGHRFVPVVSVGAAGDGEADVCVDAASLGAEGGGAACERILACVRGAVAGEYVPRAAAAGRVDFSIPRGNNSISL